MVLHAERIWTTPVKSLSAGMALEVDHQACLICAALLLDRAWLNTFLPYDSAWWGAEKFEVLTCEACGAAPGWEDRAADRLAVLLGKNPPPEGRRTRTD